MGKIIKFKEEVRKRLIENGKFDDDEKYDTVYALTDFYNQLLVEDPKDAIERLQEFTGMIKKVNTQGQFFDEMKDPHHEWTGPLLDLVGAMYPALENDLRKKALNSCIGFLDSISPNTAQDNLGLINDPLLVSDIVINRPIYWCGLKKYTKLLLENPQWHDLESHMMFSRSEFLLSYTISMPKYSSLEIRRHYYRQYDNLMDSTKDGIAAIVYNCAEYKNRKDGTCIGQEIDERLSDFDTLLHDSILRKIEEKKWIRLDK